MTSSMTDIFGQIYFSLFLCLWLAYSNEIKPLNKTRPAERPINTSACKADLNLALLQNSHTEVLTGLPTGLVLFRGVIPLLWANHRQRNNEKYT